MRMPQGAEWLILLLIIVLLFGAKRLPDAARGIGRSLRIFKAETKALGDDETPASNTAAPQAVESPAPTAQATPTAPAPPAGDPVNVSPPADQRPA